MKRLLKKIGLTVAVAAASVMTVSGQLPIPVSGPNPAQGGAPAGAQGGRGGGRGGRGQAAPAPVKQVVTPIPTAVEVTGPGEFFETFMDDYDDAKKSLIPPKDIYEKFNYEAKEYFISGMTSGGMPYKTRIVLRKPKDNAKFNGLILAESMHPSGNPWVFQFTQTYAMTAGVIGLEILTSTPAGLAAANAPRYKDLVVPNGATNDIVAQAGALIKSDHNDNPLSGLCGAEDDPGRFLGLGCRGPELSHHRSHARRAGGSETDLRRVHAHQCQWSDSGYRCPHHPGTHMRETFSSGGTTQPDK